CVAGWLDRKPDLLPIRMTVYREPGLNAATFNVQTVRQKALLPNLVLTALANGIDMEGDPPDELTAELTARVEIEGRQPLVVQDTFSGAGFAGGRAGNPLFGPGATRVGILPSHPLHAVRVNRIECETQLRLGRRSADIEAVELDADMVSPGSVLRGVAFVRPYKSARQRLPFSLKLPSDLPEGSYTVTVSDGVAAARQML